MTYYLSVHSKDIGWFVVTMNFGYCVPIIDNLEFVGIRFAIDFCPCLGSEVERVLSYPEAFAIYLQSDDAWAYTGGCYGLHLVVYPILVFHEFVVEDAVVDVKNRIGDNATQSFLGYRYSSDGYYYCDDKDNWQKDTGYNEVYDK